MADETPTPALQNLIAAKKELPGALLPILHDIQDALGYVPPEAVSLIARELNLSRAEVHGVVTFYHHFRTEPVGQHVVQICRAEACQSMGAEHLWQHACRHLGLQQSSHEHSLSTADGSVSVQAVYCLGLCSSSPAMAIDEKVYARVSGAKFDKLIAALRSSV